MRGRGGDGDNALGMISRWTFSSTLLPYCIYIPEDSLSRVVLIGDVRHSLQRAHHATAIQVRLTKFKFTGQWSVSELYVVQYGARGIELACDLAGVVLSSEQ